MKEAPVQQEYSAWMQPAHAAALFALDPAGLQGIVLKARPGPVREAWLEQLRGLIPTDAPWRRMPLHIGDDGLLGGLDLAATLRSSKPVAQRGLLADCHNGVLLLAMAERLEVGVAARLAAVLDSGEVVMERGGLSRRAPARLGMVALDEGIDADEATPPALADRFAIHLNLDAIGVNEIGSPYTDAGTIAAAKQRLPQIRIKDALVEVLCKAALGFGIESLRVTSMAIRVARASAALAGNRDVGEEDVEVAAQMVFGCRVQKLPEAEQQEEQGEEQEEKQEEEPQEADSEPQAQDQPPETDAMPEQDPEDDPASNPQTLDDQILEATQAAIPPQLLQQLQYPNSARNSARSSSRSAAKRRPARRGRPVGTRPGNPADGSSLNLVETLRAAAPWQPLRRMEVSEQNGGAAPLVWLRHEDFRVNRYQQRAATTTIFTVDASGSAALHRLAEAKGAVELMLAESYQRRDQVALVSFRGQGAELLLSPTRSLVQAKRGLAALPGGGGTPLAAGIRLALDTALSIRRRDETPVIILLTDGRANIALDGKADRQRAQAEAMELARGIRAEAITALLVDTSPRPRPVAKQLADAMEAYYLALPHADAARLTSAAQTVLSGQASGG